MNEIVSKIVRNVFDIPPSSIEEIKGKGKNNLVLKVHVNGTFYILRVKNSEQELKTYQKEQWVAKAVQGIGIPTPTILKTGTADGYSFSFQEYIEGVQGTDAPLDLSRIWSTLGQYAKSINKIPAPDLKMEYKNVVQDLFENDFFTVRNIFSQELSAKIRERLEETTAWEFSPMLCHGNLHPSNVIIDRNGTIYLIDWETATGNRAPHSELGEIYTWNNGKENIREFTRGYGLSESQTEDMMRDIQTLVLLRLVSVIRRKIDKGGDWNKDDYIQDISLKLSAITDYQQDILFTKNS